MGAAACAQPSPAGPVYTRRQPEKTALYQVMQRHLLTFEQQWTDEASGRLHILPDGAVRLDFKKPWSDGTASCDLEPLALIARLAALVPPPRRHLTLYCGVLSSHARLRSQVVPTAPTESQATAGDQPARKSKYIPWAELLRRTFAIDIKCAKCGSPLRLIALIKTRAVIEKILAAMHLPADVPELHPARPPPGDDRETRDREEQLN